MFPGTHPLALARIAIRIAHARSFNAGVLVLNLAAWRAAGTTARAERITQRLIERGASVYRGIGRGLDVSSQTPLLVMFATTAEPLPARWNVHGLGFRTDLPVKSLRDACALHWSGRDYKPWQSEGRGWLLGNASDRAKVFSWWQSAQRSGVAAGLNFTSV